MEEWSSIGVVECRGVEACELMRNTEQHKGISVEKDGARHSDHANSTDCDDVTRTLCNRLCARVCGGVR